MKYDNSSDRKKREKEKRARIYVIPRSYDIWWLSLATVNIFFPQRHINDRWVRDNEQAWTFWNYCSCLLKKKKKKKKKLLQSLLREHKKGLIVVSRFEWYCLLLQSPYLFIRWYLRAGSNGENDGKNSFPLVSYTANYSGLFLTEVYPRN